LISSRPTGFDGFCAGAPVASLLTASLLVVAPDFCRSCSRLNRTLSSPAPSRSRSTPSPALPSQRHQLPWCIFPRPAPAVRSLKTGRELALAPRWPCENARVGDTRPSVALLNDREMACANPDWEHRPPARFGTGGRQPPGSRCASAFWRIARTAVGFNGSTLGGEADTPRHRRVFHGTPSGSRRPAVSTVACALVR